MPGIIRGFHPTKGAIDLLADKLGDILVVHGPEHYMTHEGKHFTLAHHFSDIDTAGYGRIRFKTPEDKFIHGVFFGMGTSGITLAVFRAPEFTHAEGNVIAAVNRSDPHLLTDTDPLAEACHTPDGAGSGTQWLVTIPVGAGGQPAFAGPGQSRDANEVVLALDTVYLIEAVSLADNNQVTIGMDFYWRDED